MQYFVWACLLGMLSAVSLPLGSCVGIRFKFVPRVIAILAAIALRRQTAVARSHT